MLKFHWKYSNKKPSIFKRFKSTFKKFLKLIREIYKPNNASFKDL